MAEAIFIPMIGGLVVYSVAKRKEIRKKNDERLRIIREEGKKGIDERLERIREERRVGEIVRIRMKVLENQFIDEFPELSLEERIIMSETIANVESKW